MTSEALQSPLPRAGEPMYGTTPRTAVRRGFAQYLQFDGRASLSEFWWWYLFYFVVAFGLVLTGGLILANGADTRGTNSVAVVFFVLALVFVAGVILPTVSLASRRLHDAGFSALYLLLGLVSGLIVLVLCAFPTSPKGDRYAGPGSPIDQGRSGYPGGPRPPGYPHPPADRTTRAPRPTARLPRTSPPRSTPPSPARHRSSRRRRLIRGRPTIGPNGNGRSGNGRRRSARRRTSRSHPEERPSPALASAP